MRRIAALRKMLRGRRLDAVLVTTPANVRYMTGFTGSSGFALLTRDRALFCTDFRYTEQAGIEVAACELFKETGRRISLISELVRECGIRRLGFETSVSYEFYEGLAKLHVETVPLRGVLERLRAIKDETEVALIRKAIARAEAAFLAVKPRIRPGSTERSIALRLEQELKQCGCKHAAFAIIVASGPHASMPHAQPTHRKIGPGDFVIIDWGGEADGYHSDMTRTLVMAGGDLRRQRRVYDLVNRARAAAIASVRHGVKTCEIDAAARQVISGAGYGEAFGHGTGHGIGLDVHEYPRISWATGDRINSGMIFSIEPGIYLPGLGGVRIEDLVQVQENRATILTSLDRDFELVGSR